MYVWQIFNKKTFFVYLFSAALGGRDYESLSASLGVRGSGTGGGYGGDFRSALGKY